tara:strand:+ start:14246 stop:15205 length:960 start_codon:yes stop_codon:yes gene_type:complete
MKTEFIGEGSYGCVLKPAKNCDIKLNLKDTVVKLFKDEDDYNDELNNQEIIEKIFKKNKNIIVKKLSNCKKKINEYNKKDYIHCEKLYKGDDNQIIYQIVYEYGGTDLWELRNKNKINFKKLFMNLDNIFDGLDILQKNKYMHQDIRPPNILLNIKKNISKIIDFGFLIEMKNYYHKSNEFISYESNYLYPPEINKDNFMDFFNLYKNLIIRYQNNFINNKKKREQFKNIVLYLYKRNKLYYKYKKTKINLNKFDIYMFGIVLFDLLIKYNLFNKLGLNNYEYNLILSFIKNLINFDIDKRYSVKKAKNEYYKIKKTLK